MPSEVISTIYDKRAHYSRAIAPTAPTLIAHVQMFAGSSGAALQARRPATINILVAFSLRSNSLTDYPSCVLRFRLHKFSGERRRVMQIDDQSERGTRSEEDRRTFLKACGRFAAITPPAITALLSTSLTSGAIAASGSGGSGGGDAGAWHGGGDTGATHGG
jgi:hypothetical protein